MANITGSFLTPTGLNSSINSTLSPIILEGKDFQNEPRSRLLNFSPVILFSALLVAIVIGNMLVLYCLQRIKEVGAITKIFLRNLAVTDLGVGCFCIPTSLASSFHRGLSKKKWFCDLNGAAMIIFLFASILTLSSISVQKYSSVGNRLQSFFTKRVARTFIAAIWTISTIFAVGPIIGWSFYKTSEGGFQCGPFAWTISGRVYSACLFIVGMLTPVAVMIFCYLKIFINISVYIGSKRTDTCDPSRDKELQRRAASACSRDKEFQRLATIESRLLHTLFIMAISFAICWTPCMVLVIIEFAQLADPLEFEVFALACAYASSAVNPIIYTLRHESFRRSFKRVIISSFRGIFCRARCYTHKEAIDIMGLDTMRRNRRIAVITGDENDLFQENAPREAFAE